MNGVMATVAPSDEDALLRLLHRWRDEAVRAGRNIERITVTFEAGRDGFWLARWLRAHNIEAYVIHPTSVAVSREHRRAKIEELQLVVAINHVEPGRRGRREVPLAGIPRLAAWGS